MGGLFILLGLLIALTLLFFPIYIEADFQYQLQDRKIAFAVFIFKKFKVIGGYITDYPGGFAFHTGKEKVILMPLNDAEGRKKRISIFRRFRISDFAITTETGAEYLPLTMLLHAILRRYFLFQGGEEGSFQSHIWLKNRDDFILSINGIAKINLYMQICAWISVIKERLTNGKRKGEN